MEGEVGGVAAPRIILSVLLGGFSSLVFLSIPTATETVNRDGVDVAASISHEWPSKVFPYIEPWTKEYGTYYVGLTFMFAAAHVQKLYVTDVELLKQIFVLREHDWDFQGSWTTVG
ncbi:hypothetical protein DVH24_025861 [Malus domestica]|uniref:Uncharacterized protein n=1 Tax=Malus domestica TaxID=3750 RepID=A0A498KLT6_MALDO|nr:hypothetical protein DVH24_025861 [Malus domestica]